MPRGERAGDWQALGTAVRDARLRAGYDNGQQFAAQAGVSSKPLYALENGRPVAEQTIIRVVDALGWPPDRWREILRGPPGERPDDEPEPEIIVDVPRDEWARLPEEDRERVRDLVRRLATDGD